MLATLDRRHVSRFTNFKRVCRINDDYGAWRYSRIDGNIMYDIHTSWVYFITVNGVIYKIGASGVPLGIRDKEGQPIRKSTCRLGRYRTAKGTANKCDTDEYCRTELADIVLDQSNVVEFWALKCPVEQKRIEMAGDELIIESEIHWQLEKALIEQFVKVNGELPKLNKGIA